MMKYRLLFVILFLFGFCNNVIGQDSPAIVAKQFCIAVYNNDMKKAKSFMTSDDARRTPDNMHFAYNEGQEYLKKLSRAKYKEVEGITSSIVTVRFYDPDYEYLDKRGRWFCCAISLVKIAGVWKVTSYGY